VIDSVLEKKGENITVLDLQGLTSFTDYFLICSADSEPQMKTIFRSVEERLSQGGVRPHHVEGQFAAGWVLMDYDDFIVHIFSPEKRLYYELERLWADAPRMDVEDTLASQRGFVKTGIR